MKIRAIATLLFVSCFSLSVMANECEQTCESEYQECKGVAESATAKQACEDDLNACKQECK